MFVAVIFASGTTAPDGSVTVPRMLAYRLSACAGGVATNAHNRPSTTRSTTKPIEGCFMKSLRIRHVVGPGLHIGRGPTCNDPSYSTATNAVGVPKTRRT